MPRQRRVLYREHARQRREVHMANHLKLQSDLEEPAMHLSAGLLLDF